MPDASLDASPEPAAPPGRRHGADRPSLAFHLALLCLVLLAPIVLLSGLLLHNLLDAERERLWRDALDRAHAIVNVIERDVAGQIIALQALAASPNLDEATPEPGALDSFARQARAMARLLRGAVTLRAPAPPAAGRGMASSAEEQVLLRQEPVLSGLREKPEGGYHLRLAVPVMRHNAVQHILSLDLSPDWLRDELLRTSLPPGWVALVVDAEQRLIARTERHEEFLGRHIDSAASLPLQATPWQARSLTGEQVMVGYSVSALSGWVVGVLAPTRLAEDALRDSKSLMGLTFLVMALLAVGLTLLFAQRIARPVRALARAAEALGRGQTVRLAPLPVQELNEVGTALVEASRALQRRGAALAESEARLARALKAGRIATWEWEAAGDSLTGSSGREALYGLPPGALRDRAALLATTHPEDRSRLQEAMRVALAPGGSGLYDVKFRILRPDGAVRWLRSQGAVVERDAAGQAARLSGVVMDITAAQMAMEREQVLVSEVDHRARNVLTVVQSILRMSRADDPATFAEAVRGRVGALARAHTLLARERWSGGEWHALLRDTLSAYLPAGRILMQGPPLTLAAHSVQPMAMVLHELASNAARHGALSHERGRVKLSWIIRESQFLILWTELDGPPLSDPPLVGFGLRMVEGTIRRQMGGTVEMAWAGGGLSCRIILPAERTLRDDGLPPGAYRPSEAAIARFG